MTNNINKADLDHGTSICVRLANGNVLMGYYLEHDLVQDTFVISREFDQITHTFEDRKNIKISEIDSIYYLHETEEELFDVNDDDDDYDEDDEEDEEDEEDE